MLNLRLRPEIYAELKAKANARGISPAAFIAQLIEHNLKYGESNDTSSTTQAQG